MPFNASDRIPNEIARCSCGVPTNWVWNEECGEWFAYSCVACFRRLAKKAEVISNAVSSSGRLTAEQSARFVDLVIKASILANPRPRWWDVVGWIRYLLSRSRVKIVKIGKPILIDKLPIDCDSDEP